MDAETFKRTFLPFHRKLYFVAYRLLENEADAEDLVQEAYLKMWNKRDGLTIISNPEAFTIRLVKNMCYDILRSGKSILNRQTVELGEVNEITNSDTLESRDEVRIVKNIIAELPDKQQKIVILRDIKECSYEEIEQITGLSSVNVRVLLSRARKKIREEYNKLSSYESRGN
ncbi:RNA polymerase sigma factor [Bacteroides sp. 519]|uniref:RNA polymerase sigma factor n=1 Tax=Bacteroides sp. 519 TaxID=2302937 RepID=UPI0013D07CEB|nr:RNA polymerase sigma factor [Bacteroides sp. 519]NDV57106.1 RNA polymerase sigma factor [Bacteroides sp. 519]